MEENTICVGDRPWRPTNAETIRIKREPVPDSVRLVLADPCASIITLGVRLMAWHRAFGTTDSAGMALSFIEQVALRELPRPDAYAQSIERAWRAALSDLRRAHQARHQPLADREASNRLRRESRFVGELERLLDQRIIYAYLAQFHLETAEEFGSLSLLQRTERYVDALFRSQTFLQPLEDVAPASGLLHFNLHTHRTDDFRLRTAVLRAELTRSADDRQQASEILQSVERPFYHRAAQVAFSGGHDFCDISSGWGPSEEVETACREDDELDERVISYWVNRAALDLVSDRGPTTPAGEHPHRGRTWDLAIQLLEREQHSEGGRCCYRRTDDDLLRLRLMRARFHERALTNPEARDRGFGYDSDWRNALDFFAESERLVRPYEAPARFRRIAEAWLSIWSRGDSLFEPDHEGRRPGSDPDMRRYAAYLRAILSDLDAITVGSNAGAY